MTLYINSNQNQVMVSLKKGKKILDTSRQQNKFGSQILLPLINKLLFKNNLSFVDLSQIEIETGPGSFTGLRVGVSVANALGFSLRIPVNGKKMETNLKYT